RPGRGPAPPAGPWEQARSQAREALTNATVFLLRPGTPRLAWPPAASASPLARRLDEAAPCLATRRDLLPTPLTPRPHGGRGHQPPWALAITSERLQRALLTELAALTHQIAHHTANIAVTPVPGAPARTGPRRRLAGASQWLWALTAAVHGA